MASPLSVYANPANWGTLRSQDNSSAVALAGGGTLSLEAYQTPAVGFDLWGAITRVWEELLEFDTSSIPNGATVTSAVLSLKAYSYSNPPVLELYAYDFGASVTTADWVPGADFAGMTRLAMHNTNGAWTGSTRYDFTSDAAFVDAINVGGLTRVVLVTEQIANNTSGGDWYANAYSPAASAESYRPQLVVTYTYDTVGLEASGYITLDGAADLLVYDVVQPLAASGSIALDGAADLHITLSAALMAAAGTVALAGSADLSVEVYLAATGSLALDGEAWLTTVLHGEDTLQAVGSIELRGTARLSTGETLPPTDDLGWTAPDVTIPDLCGLLVSVGGLSVKRAQMTDLVIELDTEGGPKSATLSVNCALTRAPKLMQTLVVTYKGQTLFRGRLENISSNVDSSTGYTLTYAGPLVTLRDHKAFRCVYVNSDLQSWQTDQGPRTSPDTFEVASRSSGATT